MNSPYSGLPDHHFWRRAVASVEQHRFDPVVAPRFHIGPEDRVATAGSCFAQHIARRLRALGDNYFVVEDGAHLDEAERARRQYGLFSARYGNIYTTAQLWQLYQEAYGLRRPADTVWPGRNGGWIDPLRQTVEPEGFADPADVLADREVHLAAVRRLLEGCDVLVFTLGLTEAWRARGDGSVFPLAPGVAGGAYDPIAHEFVNLDLAATVGPLAAFLDAAKAANPGLRVILTVSPVPLAATYEDRHVLVSTTYSKSVLRVAAEEMFRRHDWVDYFPSYEIITGPMGVGYYADDLREVTSLGVAHVMRVFERHYLQRDAGPAASRLTGLASTGAEGVVCDETLLETVRNRP